LLLKFKQLPLQLRPPLARTAASRHLAPLRQTPEAPLYSIFAITPDSGYRVDVVYVDGQPLPNGPVVAYAFSNISTDHTISASFATSPTWTVTTLTDDVNDSGSLRYAITNAVAGDTIYFADGLTGTITTENELNINKYITIRGPGADKLLISRGTTTVDFSVFNIVEGVNASLMGLSITNGTGTISTYGALAGGGIINHGNLALTGCSIHDNSAIDGAGISNVSDTGLRPILVIADSVIYNNTSASVPLWWSWCGGGLHNENGDVDLTNSTISGNATIRINNDLNYLHGGGIVNRSAGTMTIQFSTIANNSESGGWLETTGGLASEGRAEIKHSIISGNAGGDCYIGSGSITNSLVKDGSCGLAPVDPMLGDLTNNGGPTLTHGLLPGSPAIDTADVCTVAADQRGVARPQGSACDLGAFEVIKPTITTSSLPSGIKGQAYSATLTATGGNPSYTWTIIGSLPPGLTLNSSTGVISGTPTKGGTYSFTAQVTDANNSSTTKALSIIISNH